MKLSFVGQAERVDLPQVPSGRWPQPLVVRFGGKPAIVELERPSGRGTKPVQVRVFTEPTAAECKPDPNHEQPPPDEVTQFVAHIESLLERITLYAPKK